MLCEQLKSVGRTWPASREEQEKRIQDTPLAACAGSVHCEKRVREIKIEMGNGSGKDYKYLSELSSVLGVSF